MKSTAAYVMTPSERVARWMGYRPANDKCGWVSHNFGYTFDLHDYTQEGPHWPAVYAELERRGLCMKYRYHQAEAVKPRAISLWNEYPEESFDCSMAYAIATATPAQRLEALLRVIEEEEKHAG